MTDDFKAIVEKEWASFQETHKNRAQPNILILGQTGCGKSSLINLIFGGEIAKTSNASRGTEGFEVFKGGDLGVNLTDSRGYEMTDGKSEDFASYRRDIEQKLKGNPAKAPLERIHIVWYCISVATNRIQEYDLKLLEMLLKEKSLRGRVAVVFTKCDEDSEDGSGAGAFREILNEHFGKGILETFEVSNHDDLQLDLEKLISWSAMQVDCTELKGDLREAFVAAQMSSLKAKRDLAEEKIKWYATGSGAIGAMPLPIVDMPVLIGIQTTMAAHIISIYGLDKLAPTFSALIGSSIVGNLGRAAAKSLTRFIPVVGMAVNAAVAASFTTAMGYGISRICYKACEGVLRGENVDFATVFSAANIEKVAAMAAKS